MNIFSVIAGYSLEQLLVAILVIAAAVMITIIVVRAMGAQVPAWFIQILWVVAAVVVGIIALRIIFSL